MAAVRSFVPGGCIGIALALGLAFGALSPARAGDVQVPLDQHGKILRLEAPLARQLNLFVTEYPGFQEALLYLLPDSTYSLEIGRLVDHASVRVRIAMSAASVDSLRQLVSARILERAPAARYSQDGRPVLLASSALLGFGFYGWALPYSLDMGGNTAAGAYMLTAAGTIILTGVVTRGRDVSYPMTVLGTYGATRGIAHGVLIGNALNQTNDDNFTLQVAMVTSLLEGVGGYAWGTKMSPGEAGTIVTGGDLGLGYGLGISQLSGALGDGAREGEVAVTTLVASAAGLAAGHALGRARDYSYGDARIMRGAGWLGTYTGLAIASLNKDVSAETQTAASMAGAAVGLAVGDRLVAGAGYSFGQSVNVDFMSLAGGAIAWGIVLTTEPSGGFDNDSGVFLASTAAGAIAGYGVSLALQPRGGRPVRESSLRLGVEPRWVAHDGRRDLVPHVVVATALP